MRTAALASLVLAVLCAGGASAGVIRGTLVLGGGAKTGRPDPGLAEAVIFIEAVPEKVERKLSGGQGWWPFFHHAQKPQHAPRIVQAGMRFKPRVLATTKGQAVEFVNLDNVYHNAFSVSAAKSFDLGKYAPGKRDTVMFDRTGVVNLHCDIHPQEVGYVVIVPNHAMTRPDSLGRYALPKLPEGHYTVRAWTSRRGEIHRDVEVPRRGDVTLDLRY